MAANLKQLLEQSRRLTDQISSSVDLPQIERGLGQIENSSRKLAAKAARTGDGIDSKAHYLLADGGFNADELTQTLNSINPLTTFEPLKPIHDTDIEGHLRHEYEQIIISAIEEGRKQSLKDFDSTCERLLSLEWERSKKKIFEELGQHKGRSVEGMETDFGSSEIASNFLSSSKLGASTLGRSVRSGNQSASGLQAHSRMIRYANVVKVLNDHRLNKEAYGVVHAFEEIAKSLSGDMKAQQIIDSWKLLATVVGEQHVINGVFQRQTLEEGQYSRAYLNENYSSSQAVKLRQELVDNSRKYLEDQFLEHIEKTIIMRPQDANLGGIPSIHNKIRAYINLKLWRPGNVFPPHLEVYNNTPIWAHIYYLLRSGHAQEAYKFALEHQNYLQNSESSFVAYFKAYLNDENHLLPNNMREYLLAEYTQQTRNVRDIPDPYKIAVYKILGRCELKQKTVADVIQTTEDYLWLQLTLIRESIDPSDLVHERYSLRDLQTLLLKFGAAHFNPKGNNPIHYFQVLLLSCQFERAVHYLYVSNRYQVEAVHFAIALAYYGLLKVPRDLQNLSMDFLIKDTDSTGFDSVSFNIPRMIHQYTNMFARSDPLEALHYLCILCLFGHSVGQDYITLCHDYICDLVMETGDYQTLLGDLRPDGTHQPGSIEKYLPLISIQNEKDFVRDLTKRTAERNYTEGKFSDALRLYDLAEDYDTVIMVIIKQLSDSLAAPLQKQQTFANDVSGVVGLSSTSNIKTTAEEVISHYMQSPEKISKVSEKSKETCGILLKLLEFKSLAESNRWEDALMAIEALNIIPLENDMSLISRKVDEFKGLDENIGRHFPDILLTTMNVLSKIYGPLKNSPYSDSARQNKMLLIRQKARALMVFAGMIQFRMPADTYAQLNRLDVFMN
ncbi:NIC-domain-containing protein [Basidiobolus meristosporus CBS 931.73]|uniref:Nuclear pore protein n=1 Tax=Basidiobolus meristosporus CBS 931.73 TaxID=1314790 RepID=A0A1Y1XWW1_9FUNG|nr:NIC-domain-containing protein [Basidiobolus meristosporus CBS 931.73]|eukprot:ORX90251.1 NIC-domain-containing protein [Basidiobolus meristosporus CBS 931.73]